MIRVFGRLALALSVALSSAGAAAAWQATGFELGIGQSRITADELVYDGDDRISRLTWTSRVPVLSAGARYALPQGWELGGRLVTALGDDGYMADYDWLRPWASGSGLNDWTHRSQHPATDLRRYLDVDVTIGRQVASPGGVDIGLHAGLKYTEASWRARGGSFVYSEFGFRDAIFDLPDSELGIDYLQRHKAIYAGAEARYREGAWQVAGLLRAGVSVQPREVDLHWQRDLRFDHSIGAQPYLSLGLSGSYDLRENLTLGVEASWQRFFERRGDARISDIRDGTFYLDDRDSIGGELTTANVTVSLTSRF